MNISTVSTDELLKIFLRWPKSIDTLASKSLFARPEKLGKPQDGITNSEHLES